MSAQRNEEIKKLLSTLDKISQQQKQIEQKIRQTDRRLFRSTVDGNYTFQIRNLTQRSVLEGTAKMLVKAKKDVDRKIEELVQSGINLDDTLNQSLDSSILLNISSGPDRVLNFSNDAFAGYATELFASYRNS